MFHHYNRISARGDSRAGHNFHGFSGHDGQIVRIAGLNLPDYTQSRYATRQIICTDRKTIPRCPRKWRKVTVGTDWRRQHSTKGLHQQNFLACAICYSGGLTAMLPHHLVCFVKAQNARGLCSRIHKLILA
jgi:hypothetical protein